MLTRRDLEQIRAIIREEIDRRMQVCDEEPSVHDFERELTRAGRQGRVDFLAMQPAVAGEDREVTEVRKELREQDPKRKARAAARAASPIPDGPFVDIYDARRLLAGTGATANAWIRRGRLKRTKVDGCVRISRADIDAIIAERKR